MYTVWMTPINSPNMVAPWLGIPKILIFFWQTAWHRCFPPDLSSCFRRCLQTLQLPDNMAFHLLLFNISIVHNFFSLQGHVLITKSSNTVQLLDNMVFIFLLFIISIVQTFFSLGVSFKPSRACSLLATINNTASDKASIALFLISPPPQPHCYNTQQCL